MANLEGPVPLLRTEDMAKTIAFYTEVLGFNLESAWPEENPGWCMLDNGHAHFMFYVDDNEKTEIGASGRFYLYTDDVMGLLDQVKDKAKVVEGPEVYFYGMKEIAIQDCNGYTLAFGQETDEEPTCLD